MKTQNQNPSFGRSISMTLSWLCLSGLMTACNVQKPINPTEASSIILDLDGNGVQTVGLEAGVHFDHNANGFAQLTGWVGPGDGLLVWDIDSSGQIDNGWKLFVGHPLLAEPSQEGTKIYAFEALAQHDTQPRKLLQQIIDRLTGGPPETTQLQVAQRRAWYNHGFLEVIGKGDSRIDAQDPIWQHLRVWVDTDINAKVSEGELFTLDQLGIQSINLDYTNSSHEDEHGNVHKQVGSFTWANGQTGTATAVLFKQDNARTISADLRPVPGDIARLPNLPGIGNVHSLHQAMARDDSGQLKALVQRWMQAPLCHDSCPVS